MIPNPDLQTADVPGFTVLTLPDERGRLLFRAVRSEADINQASAAVGTTLGVNSVKFDKWRAVLLGPNKLHALIGGGRAVSKDGSADEVGFGVIKGTPSLFVVFEAEKGASDDLALAKAILEHIKKKPALHGSGSVSPEERNSEFIVRAAALPGSRPHRCDGGCASKPA